MVEADFLRLMQLDERLRVLSQLNLAPLMQQLGTRLRESTWQHFTQQKAPDGQAWIPSKAAMAAGRLTLINTTRLFGSIKAVTGNDYAEVGTNVPYGRKLQEAGDWVFLGMGAKDWQMVEMETQRYLESVLS